MEWCLDDNDGVVRNALYIFSQAVGLYMKADFHVTAAMVCQYRAWCLGCIKSMSYTYRKRCVVMLILHGFAISNISTITVMAREHLRVCWFVR